MAEDWFSANAPAATPSVLTLRPREDVMRELGTLKTPAPAAPAPATDWFASNQPAATDEERRTVLGFLGNVAGSTGHLIGGLVNVPRNIEGMSQLIAGMAEKSGFKALPGNLQFDENAPKINTNAVDALIGHYKDRYGSLEGFKKALYDDPAGVAMDAATVLEPAAAGLEAANLPRLASAVTTAARTINPVVATTRLGGAVAGRVLPAIDTAMEAAAQNLRESALRGGYTIRTPHEEVAGAAEAMRGKPLTPEALAQVQAEKQALQTVKMQKLAEAEFTQGAAVPRSRIIEDLQDLRDRYENQGLAENDLRKIDKAIDEVQRTRPEQIPATKAEAIKEGTPYREGVPPDMQATVAAEQQIASTIRQSLVEQVPELAEINKSQQGKIWLEKFMDTAINKYLNSPGFIGKVADVGAVKAAAGLMSDPVMQSQVAVLINRAQELNPIRWGRPSMATSMARAGAIAQDMRVPVERRLAAPAQETIIPPAPVDTSFVRGVPAEYARPEPVPPERWLTPGGGAIVPPAPPDTSYARGVPAQYAPVQIPMERRLPPPPTVTPAPPDTSFVRAVAAQYPEVLPPELRSQPPAIEIPPPPARPPQIEIPPPKAPAGMPEIGDPVQWTVNGETRSGTVKRYGGPGKFAPEGYVEIALPNGKLQVVRADDLQPATEAPPATGGAAATIPAKGVSTPAEAKAEFEKARKAKAK